MKRLLTLFLATALAANAAENLRDLTLSGLLNRIRNGAILTVQAGGEIVVAANGKLTIQEGAIVTGLVGASYTFTAADFNLAGSTVSLDYTNAQKATTSLPGFMTAADKAKLDGIATGATANSTDAQLRDRSTHTGTQAISTITGLQAALDAGATFAALLAVNGSGPNAGNGLVHWSQLVGVPNGFADGTDDGAGGSSNTYSLPLRKTGDDVSIDPASTSAPGSMSAADKTKLNGIATGATANDTDANLRARASHTGEQAISTITGLQTELDGKSPTSHSHSNATTGAAGFMSAADKSKLDGVASGATANDTDANLRARASHTGEQAISTVTGLQTALDGKQPLNAQLTALGNITYSSDMLAILAAANSSAARVALGTDSYESHGNAGADEAFSAATAYHSVTLDQATSAFTFTNWPASGTARTITIEARQDGTGGRAATWPAAVTGSYEINPAANAVTFISLTTRDGGTTIHALSTYSSTGGTQNAFTIVQVPGQSNITAGSATANFTINATGGLQATTNNTTNTITLSGAGISGGSVPNGMSLLMETANLGSLSSDFFISGNYGTAPEVLGNYTVVVKSLGTVATPTVDIAPGAVPSGTVITFNSTTPSLTNFRATTNGTDPSYTIGTAGGNFTVVSNGTVEVVGNKQGWVTSAVASFAYTIDPIPTLSSAALQASGTDIVIGWPENVSYGAGGSGGYALTLSGGAATVTGVTGGGTNTHTLTVNRTVTNAETGTLAYTQPGNGAEDSAGQDVVTFSGFTINMSGGPAGGGASASDTFEAMTSGDLLSVSGNWAGVGTNAMTAVTEGGGKVAFANSAGDVGARYTATAFAANHSAEITLYTTGTPTGGVGPAVRMQSGADTYYFAYYDETNTDLYLYRRTAGTNAQVGSTYNVDLADTNKIKLTVSGTGSATRLTVALDTGSGYADVGALTSVDPSGTYIDGGQPGIYGWGANQAIAARVWAGADN